MHKSLALFLVLLSFSCQSKKESPTISKSEKKTLPTQNLFFARTFPDQTLDIKSMNKAFEAHETIRKQSSQKNLGPDSPWRLEGPTNIGGRLNTVVIHPQNQNIIYTGSSTGGVFKTEDGGSNWTSVSDSFDHLAIGDLVLDPSNPDIIYAGTGDPNITILPHPGNGIYKSEDAGVTWTNIGLNAAGIISEIAVHPNNSQIIYAASMGLPFEPTNDRGLYKSTDGGMNWEQVLFVSDDSGIIDIVMDPTNPDIIYAAAWDRIRNNTESVVFEDDSKIFKTTDGGATWNQLTNDLPGNDQVRIGLDISQQNPNKVFALYVGQDMEVEGIYKSLDGGANWDSLNVTGLDGALGGFGWYFGKIRVNPFNDSEISVLGVGLHTTYDEGETWEDTTPEWWTYEVHADKHDLVYYDENVRFLATDGGLYRNDNAFNSAWIDIEDLPITHFYRIAVNPHEPGVYAGGAQDNGTSAGNYNDLTGWPRIYGGDGFQPTYDPENPDLFYAETQRGGLVFNDGSGFQSWYDGIESSDRRFWDMPYIMSAHSNSRFYTGTYRVYTIDDAPYDFWYPISEDLTDGDTLGGSFNTISTVAESPINEEIIYVGTTDGNVWRTLDLGTTWTNITAGLPERYVTNIKASSLDQSIVFVSHNGYKDNDNISHLHMSLNNGDTWIDISGDLPEIPINHIELMGNDTLFIATDVGVYYSENQGENWDRIGNNMPLIPVFDIEIDPLENRLVAGTFARSIWSFPLDSLFIGSIGIDDLSMENAFQVFPNPSKGAFQIDLKNSKNNRIEIFDLNGKMLYQKHVFGLGLQTLNTELASGTYILNLINEEGKKSKKIVIER